ADQGSKPGWVLRESQYTLVLSSSISTRTPRIVHPRREIGERQLNRKSFREEIYSVMYHWNRRLLG
ncbi:MAG: hypothetical protein ACFFAY_09395, partial [Promethearchaeota archaeon]